ncbi:hypothetical protein BH24ACT5_BH24ACT5_03730 [soil metagenome]
MAFSLLLLSAGVACGSPVAESGTWEVDPAPPPELEEAVVNAFSPERCVTAQKATQELQATLDELSYGDWGIRWDVGVTADGCVSATFDTPHLEIRLIQALRPEVIAAMDGVRNQLFGQCLGEQEAIELVRSTLRNLGEVGPDVQPGGPIAWPLDRREEIERHVDAGCFIYSTIGYTAEGHRIYYVAGKQN